MPTFIQVLEELAKAEQTLTIPAGEVERLASRFGDRVRHMGRWNAGGDGSLEIPMSVVANWEAKRWSKPFMSLKPRA